MDISNQFLNLKSCNICDNKIVLYRKNGKICQNCKYLVIIREYETSYVQIRSIDLLKDRAQVISYMHATFVSINLVTKECIDLFIKCRLLK